MKLGTAGDNPSRIDKEKMGTSKSISPQTDVYCSSILYACRVAEIDFPIIVSFFCWSTKDDKMRGGSGGRCGWAHGTLNRYERKTILTQQREAFKVRKRH